ncbi:YjdF family protein [Bacteroides sp. OttesenSCG-928-D19]|nr:YjdF family protein [Bacteroides sp. OttesenSCG-928-N06]MDL2304289.1 YjdF family protein [Bacteroides sp. OttesenSCG-928-D19]
MNYKYEHTTTILFDAPFWIVLFERIENGMYSVAKEVLGTSEPTNADIILFFDRLDYNHLRYSIPVEDEKAIKPKVNFKKAQKEARKAIQQDDFRYAYSKAHVELKKLQEEKKAEKKIVSRLQKEEEKERKFELKQQKKKQKLRGR